MARLQIISLSQRVRNRHFELYSKELLICYEKQAVGYSKGFNKMFVLLPMEHLEKVISC